MKLKYFILLILGFTLWGANAQTAKKTLSEKEKIEALISSVEKLEGAKFYRNGSFYDAKMAADHLRMKVNKAGSRIKTANDFIDKIASASSMSGENYKIIYSNGKEVTTKVYFTQKLNDLQTNTK